MAYEITPSYFFPTLGTRYGHFILFVAYVFVLFVIELAFFLDSIFVEKIVLCLLLSSFLLVLFTIIFIVLFLVLNCFLTILLATGFNFFNVICIVFHLVG